MLKKLFHTIQDHTFLSSLINQNSTIIDCGANVGNFSRGITDAYLCFCFSIEASPENFEKIEPTDRVKKFHCAVMDKSGEIQLQLSDNHEANSIYTFVHSDGRTVKVKAITLKDFMKEQDIRSADLVKVDIEGAEIPLVDSIEQETLNRIKQMSIEFHDFFPEFGEKDFEDIRRVERKLKKSGFVQIVFSRDHKTDVLFINKKTCHLSLWKWMNIYFYKYVYLPLQKIKRGLR